MVSYLMAKINSNDNVEVILDQILVIDERFFTSKIKNEFINEWFDTFNVGEGDNETKYFWFNVFYRRPYVCLLLYN